MQYTNVLYTYDHESNRFFTLKHHPKPAKYQFYFLTPISSVGGPEPIIILNLLIILLRLSQIFANYSF